LTYAKNLAAILKTNKPKPEWIGPLPLGRIGAGVGVRRDWSSCHADNALAHSPLPLSPKGRGVKAAKGGGGEAQLSIPRGGRVRPWRVVTEVVLEMSKP
jgi:hypothetical protein